MGFGRNARRERSDAELLAAHVAGDRYAFSELFGRHQRHLHRLAQLTTRTPEDAEDALQDAMLSAHRGAGAFRHDAAVGSWLHRIVVNACLDRLRRSKAHPTVPLEDIYPVADRTAQVDTAMAVQRALMRLPVEQRAAVVAVDMQGYSVADTARCSASPKARSRAAARAHASGWPNCWATSTPARTPCRSPPPARRDRPLGGPRAGVRRGHRCVHDGHWVRWTRQTTMRRITAMRDQAHR